MRIDVRTHIVPERWDDWRQRWGAGDWPRIEHGEARRATILTGERFFRAIDDRSWDPARRIDDMHRIGVDRRALSPPPIMFCYWADAGACQAFARMQNENVAAIVAREPSRFVGMATVPRQDLPLAVEELRVARERLGLRAVEIGACRQAAISTTRRCSRSSRRVGISASRSSCIRRRRSPAARGSTSTTFR